MVDANEYQKNKEYNDDLREFLALVLQSEEAVKMKKYGKRVKSYVQVIGLQYKAPSEKIQEVNEKSNNKKEKKNKKQELENTIKEMSKQIKALKQIVEMLCTSI